MTSAGFETAIRTTKSVSVDIVRFSEKTEVISLNGKPGSSVSIEFGYGLDDRAIEVRSPAEANGFFL
jgi:hypothetical protein